MKEDLILFLKIVLFLFLCVCVSILCLNWTPGPQRLKANVICLCTYALEPQKKILSYLSWQWINPDKTTKYLQ